MFHGPNREFYETLRQGLDAEVGRQVEWAREWLKKAARDPTEQAIATVPREGITVAPTGAYSTGVEFTRTQLVAITERTEVLGARLEQIFAPDRGTSIWMRDNIKLIDTTVKRGFLLGETNEEIARQLPGMGRVAITRNRAIARTAVMDMSQRAHEEFWDAQDEGVVRAWVFDATFDYRVCMRCAPWDGDQRKDRSKLPRVPIHPNCRCRVLPLTETELRLRNEGERSYVEITRSKPEESSKTRVYKQKVRVGEKKLYKVARDVGPQGGKAITMAGFLQKASPETRAAVMGAANAKRFTEMTTGTAGSRARYTPEEALQEIVRNPSRRRK
jgi:hypothetical protein